MTLSRVGKNGTQIALRFAIGITTGSCSLESKPASRLLAWTRSPTDSPVRVNVMKEE